MDVVLSSDETTILSVKKAFSPTRPSHTYHCNDCDVPLITFGPRIGDNIPLTSFEEAAFCHTS